MKNLKVYQPKGCLVVENLIEKDGVQRIEKGAHIYCGCCGKSVGQFNGHLVFPFSYNNFKSRIINCKFRTNSTGLWCKKCKTNLMPNPKTNLVLTSVEVYEGLQKVDVAKMLVERAKSNPAAMKREIEAAKEKAPEPEKQKNFFERILGQIIEYLKTVLLPK